MELRVFDQRALVFIKGGWAFTEPPVVVLPLETIDQNPRILFNTYCREHPDFVPPKDPIYITPAPEDPVYLRPKETI